jgi:hypothetical protein
LGHCTNARNLIFSTLHVVAVVVDNTYWPLYALVMTKEFVYEVQASTKWILLPSVIVTVIRSSKTTTVV